ncbi:MAG: hypothetical protein WC438_04520 [Candidatus Pacearchaeota archaeon]
MGIKRGLKNIFKFSEIENAKKNVGIALMILILGLIIFSIYFLVFYAKPCSDDKCFVSSVETCKSVSWVREDEQASWIYIVKGNAGGDACKVEVRLKEMKQGTIDSEGLQGKQMTCIFQKGSTQFPEKDISQCTGPLKEELQDLIIQRMHNYLLENVGEIKQEFTAV